MLYRAEASETGEYMS